MRANAPTSAMRQCKARQRNRASGRGRGQKAGTRAVHQRRQQGSPAWGVRPANLERYDAAQCEGGALPVIMSIIGRLKPTTAVTITSKCAVQSHPPPPKNENPKRRSKDPKKTLLCRAGPRDVAEGKSSYSREVRGVFISFCSHSSSSSISGSGGKSWFRMPSISWHMPSIFANA